MLEREIYSMSEAAHLLAVKPARLRSWIDGYTRGQTHYEPVIRPEHTGRDLVTWGEFVEAGYLHEYRVRGVSLQRMRLVVQRLRERFGVPYPLAHMHPYVFGRDVVMAVQEEVGLATSLEMVRVHDGQLVLAPKAQDFFAKVEFAPGDGKGGEALRLYPDPTGRQVVLDPLLGFGAPVVRNTRTANLYELWAAGDSIAGIAEVYELPDADVEAAVRYEARLREQEETAA
ncbi:hypothetical protein KBI5_24340 [Frankia sp. KB5]|uniref:DUF433 domain-containing protein n=1 Tax=Frankia casuarinae (strain DSM 45818 / CECT 9043 / HFP020203 / CcI3) TaxID=106370 RepID=Q2JE18_FRACC|nr:conserved hypothetical protein [Frankia casuarinae]OHV47155.1 hypothetical protein CgIS1_22325 [Frankia sp. CgIS1]ORT46598.1 hypothetical protein KBI5_24340 [Frankia sp. KB5]